MRHLGHGGHARRTHCSGSRLPRSNADSSRPSCVEMVQPTNHWKLDHLAASGRLYRSRFRGVLVEGQMNAARVVEMSMPSLSSSPWMRGAPHRLAVAIRLMSLRISGSMPGRPPLDRLRQAQYLRNPARCHLITVAGFTMISASLQRLQLRDSSTQSLRSAFVRQPRTLDRALEHTQLMSEGQDLRGELTARSEERECGNEQRPDELQHGRGRWNGSHETSTNSRWTKSLGPTTVFTACVP